MFTLIVTGSPHPINAEIVWSPLWWMVQKHEAMLLRHGGAPTGVERCVTDWIRLPGQQWNAGSDSRFLVVEEMYDGYRRGPAGAVEANQEMVDAGADACFAFPDHRHKSFALDCVARAWTKGIPTYVFNFEQVGRFHRVTESEGECLARRMLHWGL